MKEKKPIYNRIWFWLLIVFIGFPVFAGGLGLIVRSVDNSNSTVSEPVSLSNKEKEVKKEAIKPVVKEKPKKDNDEIDELIVGGKFKEKDYKGNDLVYTNGEGITILGEPNYISHIEKKPSMPLDIKLDKSLLVEIATDYMPEDATLKQEISSENFIYESEKTKKKYEVVFAFDGGENVSRVIVTEYSE